ncbi:MAG: glycerophosphodiester phosphodiesterase [Caldicoprobacterales bacterium]
MIRLRAMCRFLAYKTNAYVLRSSVSFDENSNVCGASMIVSPEGKVLADMKGKFGKCTAEFSPHEKHLKPAGFGRGLAPHYEYIEEGRNPWQYRPAGSAICLDDNNMPYPRLCAHRGFNTIAPENSMPAFGAAVALGASEIEFDLWATKDRELVSLHDSTIDRVSDGSGYVWNYTYDELLQFDFGFKTSEKFKGLKIVKFEDILKKFSCHVIMNIHVKIWDVDFEDNMIDEIVKLIKKYDCEKHVYFMTSNDKILKILKRSVPQINICVGHDSARPYEIVNRAIEIGAQKVQFIKPYFNQEMIDKAHKNGIRCNIFWADDVLEAKQFLEMGIDTLLTNDYQNISYATGIK